MSVEPPVEPSAKPRSDEQMDRPPRRMAAGRSPPHAPEESERPPDGPPAASRTLQPPTSATAIALPIPAHVIRDEKTCRRMCPRLITQNEPTLLAIGDTVRNCWEIKGLIGCGGYGQIFYCVDGRSGQRVAIKAEPIHRNGRRHRRMILEQHVLVRLQGQPHVPLIFGSGCQAGVNFIVMQLLSVNLGDLRKMSPLKRLSRPTCGRVALQAIAALRDLYNAGFLHRDIKPANSKHRLFIVDYGLARSHRMADGRPRKQRERAGFRGTLRYVSLRVHDREEQGPADDLGPLIRSTKDALQRDDFVEISRSFGEPLREFGRAVYSMGVADEPNYAALQDVMRAFGQNTPLDSKYDWEADYADVLNEEEINRHLGLIN
ncbi:hypothetical protein M3Y99_00810900 [Aphelenchoides fujianensis]|nr:hypothetical protein M3Y99_00810900 [Aphelenchoides fujianensis]